MPRLPRRIADNRRLSPQDTLPDSVELVSSPGPGPRFPNPMPYINLKMYPGRSEEQKREVARRIVEAVMEVCNVPDATQCPVVIEEVERDNWATEVAPEVEAKAALRYAP